MHQSLQIYPNYNNQSESTRNKRQTYLIFHLFESCQQDSLGMGMKLMKFGWFILLDNTSTNII